MIRMDRPFTPDDPWFRASQSRPSLASPSHQAVGAPFLVTSHANETGRAAVEASWEALESGGSALDAVERATNIIEVDPEDTSVGFGGLPNEM